MAKLHPLVFATKDKEVIAHFVMKELISVDKVGSTIVSEAVLPKTTKLIYCITNLLFVCLFVWVGPGRVCGGRT